MWTQVYFIIFEKLSRFGITQDIFKLLTLNYNPINNTEKEICPFHCLHQTRCVFIVKTIKLTSHLTNHCPQNICTQFSYSTDLRVQTVCVILIFGNPRVLSPVISPELTSVLIRRCSFAQTFIFAHLYPLPCNYHVIRLRAKIGNIQVFSICIQRIQVLHIRTCKSTI